MTLAHNLVKRVAKLPFPLQAARYIRSMSSSQTPYGNDHLFNYTSGRWLWNERQQLDARYRRFNVSNLKKAACKALSSSGCISLEKIGEGNYNKAYRLVMQDDRKVIAKIPHPNAGPPMYTTASEVATMDFARIILDLPVPKVLDWSATDQNPVESEYIIMEETKGSQLHEVWQDLELRAKRDIIREIVGVEKKMLSVSFDRVGSLYPRGSEVPGCEAATTTGVSPEVRDSISSCFFVGPAVRRELWKDERSNMQQHHSPWRSAKQYLESVAQREIDWVKTYANPKKENDINPWLYTSREQTSPDAHISSLRKYISAIPDIVPVDPELVSPRLWHPDFHAGNIYVDEHGKISSIIDWQGAWTTPLFIGANPPMFLDYGVEMMMKLPDSFKELDQPTKEQLRYQVAQSILIHSYETRTAKENPLMYRMMRYPQGKTLKELEAFAGATWDNCMFPLQECLIRMKREWSDFSDGPCPYHHPDEEIRQHQDEATAFNASQEFWESIGGIVSDEGYTSNEDFEKGIEIFQRSRESGLNSLDGEEKDEFERQTRWVLDIGR